MPRKRTSYTDAQREAMIAVSVTGRTRGISWADLAAPIGVTGSQLREFVRKRGARLPHRGGKEIPLGIVARRTEAMEWGLLTDATWQQMADRAGCNTEAFRAWCRDNLKAKRPELFARRINSGRRPAGAFVIKKVAGSKLDTEEGQRRAAVIERMAPQRATLREIADELDMHPDALRKWMKAEGISVKTPIPRVSVTREVQSRKCATCWRHFDSVKAEGAWLRRCHVCKQNECDSPYALDPGGHSGRRVQVSRR